VDVTLINFSVQVLPRLSYAGRFVFRYGAAVKRPAVLIHLINCLSQSFLVDTLKTQSFHVLRRIRKIAKNDYQLRHVCLSVRMEKLSFYWNYFREI
jgi:hypothetical protein